MALKRCRCVEFLLDKVRDESSKALLISMSSRPFFSILKRKEIRETCEGLSFSKTEIIDFNQNGFFVKLI